jgi:hypothetical protein
MPNDKPTENLPLTVEQFDLVVRAVSAYTPRADFEMEITQEVATLLRQRAIAWGRLK